DLAALVIRFDRTRDGHGHALAARWLADDANLRKADLESQSAALDARALAVDLDELAADAAADDLDGVADLRRGRRRRGLLRRRVRGDCRRGFADEPPQRRGLGPGAQLVQDGAAFPLDVAHEAARLL